MPRDRRERSRARAAAFLGEDLMNELRQEYLPPDQANLFRTVAMGRLVDWGWTLEDAAAVAGGRVVHDYELGPVAWSGIVWAAPLPAPIEEIDPHEYDDAIFDGESLDPHLLATSLAEAYDWPSAFVSYQVVTTRGEILTMEAFCIARECREIPLDVVAAARAWLDRKIYDRLGSRGAQAAPRRAPRSSSA